MIATSPRNFDINPNINIIKIKIRYQCQYQYPKSHKPISIPIPKIIELKLNLKTIPNYLVILQSQAQKFEQVLPIFVLGPNITS